MNPAPVLLSSSVATLRSTFCSIFNSRVRPDIVGKLVEGSHSCTFNSLFNKSGVVVLFFVIAFLSHQNLLSQTKQTEHLQQTWFGYFNQTRFSKKWGSWSDLHVRTKENLINHFSQSIIRFGLTYYLSDDTKLTVGYAYASHYPSDNHKDVTMPEHRPWQQLQWHTRSPKLRLIQWIRLEERFRRKVLNDSELGAGYNFNFRTRYNILAQFPLSTKSFQPKTFSFIINDEIHINFGEQVVYNYFDQNRFFTGFAYHINGLDNLQFGYMNVFQQLTPGNRYRSNHVARIFYFHSLDLRKK